MGSEDETRFARGVALFNDGEYFACHEVWEELWKRSTGEDRVTLQGLIQAAAALLHAQRGNRRGAMSVYRKAKRNLEAAGDDFIGTNLSDFRRLMEEYFRSVERGATVPSRPQIATRGRL
jgi:predicted metal-dependent hydrolase